MKNLSIIIYLIAILIAGCSTNNEDRVIPKDKQIKIQKSPKERSNICPKCGLHGVPIVYGKPGRSLFKKAKKKEVYLGGCVISRHSPKYHCYKCNTNFGYEK